MVEGSIVAVEEAEAAGKENNSYYYDYYDITAIAYSSRPQRTFDLEVSFFIYFRLIFIASGHIYLIQNSKCINSPQSAYLSHFICGMTRY